MVVIPDLLRRRAAPPEHTRSSHSLSPQELTDLAQASLESVLALESLLEQLLAQGWDMGRLYLEGIAGTARQLGHWWLSDHIHFANLTIASGRLQDLVLRWEDRFLRSANPLIGASQRSCLLLGDFQDQHSLGVLMLQAFFKRDGWQVRPSAGMTPSSLLKHLRSEHVDLIGLSVATDRRLPQTRALIQDIREVSRNSDIKVMLGGPLLMAAPEVAQDLAGDLIGGEADQASRAALQLIESLSRVK